LPPCGEHHEAGHLVRRPSAAAPPSVIVGARIDRLANLVREHPAAIEPQLTRRHPLALLDHAVLTKQANQRFRQTDEPAASERLRVSSVLVDPHTIRTTARGATARLRAAMPITRSRSTLPHPQRTPLKINIWPLQAKSLTLTQPKS
jgi:hypothetical protein